MVYTGIFATSDEILVKAGENYDISVTEARINALCTQIESFINCTTRRNWSDAYATLNIDVKGLLSLAASNLVAMYIISYNLSAYHSRIEAETMLDVLRDGALKAIELLKTKEVEDFIDGET